jgi:hypothetical protein
MTHLTTYQMFQFERFGTILLQDGSSTQNPYDPKLLPKNYDYEDDDYTFTCWVENNAELELLKNELYED